MIRNWEGRRRSLYCSRDIRYWSFRVVRNKGGQLGKAITILPVFVFIFVILILYISLTISIIPFKQVKNPSIVEMNLERSLLLQSINVDGEKMLIAEGLFRYPGKKIGLVDDPAFLDTFLIAVRNFFEQYAVESPPERVEGYPDICLMLGIDKQTDIGGRRLPLIRRVNGQIIQGDNQRMKFPAYRSSIYDFPTRGLVHIAVHMKGEEHILSWYYGACKGGSK